MIDIEEMKKLNPYIEGYCKIVEEGAHERFSRLFKIKENLVVGALIARMATLSSHLMFNPAGWNYNMAAFSIRAQVECYITLAWILKNTNDNSHQYVVDSILQDEQNAKQYEKHLSDLVNTNPELEGNVNFVKSRKSTRKFLDKQKEWRQLQQAEWGTSERMPDIATMVIEAGELEHIDMYKLLCEHSHNSWCFLYHHNTKLEPIDDDKFRSPIIGGGFDISIMEKSAQYLSNAYHLFDETYDLNIKIMIPIEYWDMHECEMKSILSI